MSSEYLLGYQKKETEFLFPQTAKGADIHAQLQHIHSHRCVCARTYVSLCTAVLHTHMQHSTK